MDVQISRDGAIHHDRYERGVPVVKLDKGLLPVIGKTKKTGTKINFLPDGEILRRRDSGRRKSRAAFTRRPI